MPVGGAQEVTALTTKTTLVDTVPIYVFKASGLVFSKIPSLAGISSNFASECRFLSPKLRLGGENMKKKGTEV